MIQVRANPIGTADFHWFANRICEGTEQIRRFFEQRSQLQGDAPSDRPMEISIGSYFLYRKPVLVQNRYENHIFCGISDFS